MIKKDLHLSVNIMKGKGFIFAAFLAVQAIGCATTYELKTKPDGANIVAEGKVLGKTPFEFTSDQVSTKSANGILVRLEKDGFKPIWLWMPEGLQNYNVSVNLTPFYQRVSSQVKIDDHEMDRNDLYRLTDILLNAQKNLLMDEKIDEKNISALSEANPTLGSMHFLEALRLLKKGQKKEAIIHLRDAVRFSPGEFDFLALYNELTGAGEKK